MKHDLDPLVIMKGSHSPRNRTPEINALALNLSSLELFDNWLLSRQKRRGLETATLTGSEIRTEWKTSGHRKLPPPAPLLLPSPLSPKVERIIIHHSREITVDLGIQAAAIILQSCGETDGSDNRAYSGQRQRETGRQRRKVWIQGGREGSG